MKAKDIIIIGGGPAGVSAAIWCQRLGLDYLLIEKANRLGGQLHDIHNLIVDYPGMVYANGQELNERFVSHLEQLNCHYTIQAEIDDIDMDKKVLRLRGQSEPLHFNYVIVATGTSVRRLNIPGEQEMIDRGESYSATKDRHHFTGKKVVVVGGGDRAFEGAMLLAECGADVHLIHRSNNYRAREEFRNQVFGNSRITLIENTTVRAIAYKDGQLNHIVVENMSDGSKKELATAGVFIRIGVEPNSALVEKFIQVDADGYITVDACQCTNHPSIYAIGDVCTHPLFSSISSASAQGMVAAKHLSLQLT